MEWRGGICACVPPTDVALHRHPDAGGSGLDHVVELGGGDRADAERHALGELKRAVLLLLADWRRLVVVVYCRKAGK